MSLNAIPLWALFGSTLVMVVVAILAGHRIGNTVHQRLPEEKESPVSAASASVLGLLAFILAFTFGIVTNRYDTRKELVREEANAIRTAWLRSELLPGPEHETAAKLLRDYADLRVNLSPANLQQTLQASLRIHRQLWDTAVVNARRDLNSDIGALYMESLNALIDTHAMRVAVALYAGIPDGIWFVLFSLLFLSMFVAGYQVGIAGSTWKSWSIPLLAVAFSLVITLLVALDRPQSGYIPVSKQPLVDIKAEMSQPLPKVPVGAEQKP
jgi:hypothetical protein